MSNREMIEEIWRAGVARVQGEQAVKAALGTSDVRNFDGIIAVGKAAGAMMAAAISWSRELGNDDPPGLIVTKYGHVSSDIDWGVNTHIIEAAHPIPDKNSLAGGKALLNFVGSMQPEERLLVLVSGGASAVAEVLDGGVTLGELKSRTDELIARGASIEAINAVRREMSKIKDGKLLENYCGAGVEVMAISDVEGDDIKIIGSGIGMIDRVPLGVEAKFEIIASNAMAREECECVAEDAGHEVIVSEEDAYGDVVEVAAKMALELKSGRAGIYIWGGEPTVVLPDTPGEGGRNQHLALLLARHLKDSENIEVIVGGTDGTDGPTDAAGGFTRGGVVHDEIAIAEAIEEADARNYLARHRDLFVTGPTGTNVMDLIVAIKTD